MEQTTQVLLDHLKTQILRALERLQSSYEESKKIDFSSKNLTNEELKTLEALSARFSRSVDLFISKYLRALWLKEDPGFQGSLMDSLLKAEKAGFIPSAHDWYDFRGLRNSIVHEYFEENLLPQLQKIFLSTPKVLALKGKL